MQARFAIVAILVLAVPAAAWNKPGHMVTGAIAYAILQKEHPATLAKALAILRQHPEYESRWLPKFTDRTEPDEQDLDLFMLAPRWADDIRRTKYDRPAEHYINYPVVYDGTPAPPLPKDTILTGYRYHFGIAKSKAPDADRAIALCWLFHLVWDVHQPLHCVRLVSSVYPTGDRGGNSFHVKAKPGGAPIKPHAFWDDLILGSERFQAVRNIATELRLRPEFARDKL